MLSLSHASTHARTYTDVDTHTHTHTHTHTCTHTHAHAHTCTHTHTPTHTRLHTHAHIHTHTNTRACTHARTHTHTHTHSVYNLGGIRFGWKWWPPQKKCSICGSSCLMTSPSHKKHALDKWNSETGKNRTTVRRSEMKIPLVDE